VKCLQGIKDAHEEMRNAGFLRAMADTLREAEDKAEDRAPVPQALLALGMGGFDPDGNRSTRTVPQTAKQPPFLGLPAKLTALIASRGTDKLPDPTPKPHTGPAVVGATHPKPEGAPVYATKTNEAYRRFEFTCAQIVCVTELVRIGEVGRVIRLGHFPGSSPNRSAALTSMLTTLFTRL
jgi:hypothetical protein